MRKEDETHNFIFIETSRNDEIDLPHYNHLRPKHTLKGIFFLLHDLFFQPLLEQFRSESQKALKFSCCCPLSRPPCWKRPMGETSVLLWLRLDKDCVIVESDNGHATFSLEIDWTVKKMASNLDYAEDIEEAKAYMAKKNVFQLFEVGETLSLCFKTICFADQLHIPVKLWHRSHEGSIILSHIVYVSVCSCSADLLLYWEHHITRNIEGGFRLLERRLDCIWSNPVVANISKLNSFSWCITRVCKHDCAWVTISIVKEEVHHSTVWISVLIKAWVQISFTKQISSLSAQDS